MLAVYKPDSRSHLCDPPDGFNSSRALGMGGTSAGLAAQLALHAPGSVGQWLEEVCMRRVQMCMRVWVRRGASLTPSLRDPQTASPAERRNFFEFLHMIGHFERKLGLQQRRDPVRLAARRRAAMEATRRRSGRRGRTRTRVVDEVLNDEESKEPNDPSGEGSGDMLVVQLGSNLKCGLRFFV